MVFQAESVSKGLCGQVVVEAENLYACGLSGASSFSPLSSLNFAGKAPLPSLLTNRVEKQLN